MYKIFLILVILTRVLTRVLTRSSYGEWYSSLGHMEDLVNEEFTLISSLRDFISAEEERLDRIKQFANKLTSQAEETGNDLDQYLGHPVNQYLLLKRFKKEWDEVEELITSNSSQIFLDHLTVKRSTLPNDEDVDETAKAIMRLQDTYELDTHDLAEGIIRNTTAGRTLSADDCFSIGRTAYLDQDYYHCALWMREADFKIQNGDISHDRFEVLDHLSFSLSQQGNWPQAFRLTEEMLSIQPNHQRIQTNHDYYKQLLNSKKKGDDGEVVQDGFSKPTLKRPMIHLPERALYERLCREGGDPIPAKIEKSLKCYYWDNNDPLLKIQPLKMEEMWHDPHLVRFYDILFDSEIEAIKKMAKPMLYRATVQNSVTGNLEHAPYRVSKSAWLRDEDSALVSRISDRITAVTGLTMKTAEELQIANYGVGGQYEPHYDFARRYEKRNFKKEMGNRIATMLFYLASIEQGGSTIFLKPRIESRPIKGSAVFWYNLFPSGAGDMRTRHAACPVLTGIKWVANKWIHERGQEFRRQCKKTKRSHNRIF